MVSKPTAIRSVVFDYGCVLSLAPGPEDFEPLRLAVGVERAALQELYWGNREAYDVDAIDGTAYWQAMARGAGYEFSADKVLHLSSLDVEMWGRPNSVMVEWAHLLRERGLKTAVLSNMSRTVSSRLRQSAKWLARFDHLSFSGELRMAKPGLEIYRVCLKALGVLPRQALFLDDREVNVAAARAVGMHAIVFRSVEELTHDLEPYGLASSLAEARARAR